MKDEHKQKEALLLLYFCVNNLFIVTLKKLYIKQLNYHIKLLSILTKQIVLIHLFTFL